MFGIVSMHVCEGPVAARYNSDTMDIFISWSGPRSGALAEALKKWLPKIVNKELQKPTSSNHQSALAAILAGSAGPLSGILPEPKGDNAGAVARGLAARAAQRDKLNSKSK